MENAKLLELIEKHSHIGLLAPSHPDADWHAAAQVLREILESRGKIVGILNPTDSFYDSMRNSFPALRAHAPLPREFIVSLHTADTPIAQLRYEKHDDRIDVIFSPKQFPLRQELVSFRDGRTRCDCAIALGIADIESVENLPDPELLHEIPVINLDIALANTSFGEINIVDKNKVSLSELVYEIAGVFQEEPLSSEQSSLLLAAIIEKTDGFRAQRVGADTLLTVSELMRLGGDLSLNENAAQKQKYEIPVLQLLGRATVRSRLDESTGVLWSFLTADDFDKTGRSHTDVPSVLNHIEQEFPRHHVSVLVWQHPQNKMISATLAGDHGTLSAIEQRRWGTFMSPYLGITNSFESFREAEEYIAALLREVL